MEGRDPIVHDPKTFPGAYDGLAHVLVIPWNEFYTEDIVRAIAEVVKAAGGRAPVIAGAGSNNTVESIRFPDDYVAPPSV